jgi:hypothetical protein
MTARNGGVDETAAEEKPVLADVPVRSSDTDGAELNDDALDKISGGFCAGGQHIPEVKIQT